MAEERGAVVTRHILIPQSNAAEPAQAVGEAPHFSESQHAWVVNRPADIRAVLRDDRFGQLGAVVSDSASVSWSAIPTTLAEQPHRWWTSPESTALLRPDVSCLEGFARHLQHLIAVQVDHAGPDAAGIVDLMDTIIRPWCHHITSALLDLPLAVVEEAESLTRQVFEAAALVNPATATDTAPPVTDAADATRSLLQRLAPFRTSHRPSDGLDIQAWVALTQTLPALIGAGLLHLGVYTNGDVCPFRAAGAGAHGEVDDHALLAAASPVRAIFRTTLQHATIAGTAIAAGDRVVLAVEGHPDFVFGDGLHRCAGAALVRALFATALRMLGEVPCMVIPHRASAGAVWTDGAAMRILRSLPVEMHKPL